MGKNIEGQWQCTDCEYASQHSTNVRNHIEVNHMASVGYFCQHCDKFCKTKNALNLHRSRYKHYWNCCFVNKICINIFSCPLVYSFFLPSFFQQINTYTLHWKCRFFSRIDWIQLKNERIYPCLGTFSIYPKYLHREVPRCFRIFCQIWSRIRNDSSNFIRLIFSIGMLKMCDCRPNSGCRRRKRRLGSNKNTKQLWEESVKVRKSLPSPLTRVCSSPARGRRQNTVSFGASASPHSETVRQSLMAQTV